MLENMYARVKHGERTQNFGVWIHGEPNAMSQGAGLAVSESGITRNFHFLLRDDEPDFEISAGRYEVAIIGRMLNARDEQILASVSIDVDQNFLARSSRDFGLEFSWAPDSQRYIGRIASDMNMPLPPIQSAVAAHPEKIKQQ